MKKDKANYLGENRQIEKSGDVDLYREYEQEVGKG